MTTLTLKYSASTFPFLFLLFQGYFHVIVALPARVAVWHVHEVPPGGQKSTSNTPGSGHTWLGCYELNTSSLEEQTAL